MNLLHHLDRERFQPVVATSENSDLLNRLKASQIPHEVIPCGQINTRSLRLLWRLGCSVSAVARIIRRHRIDLIHSNTVRTHVVGALAAQITGVPLVWTMHDNTFPPLVAGLLGHIPRRVVAVSRYIANVYQPTYLDPTKCCVIYNGLPDVPAPVQARDVRRELALSPATLLVVNVGRLIPGKGQHSFVAAASRVLEQIPEARFVLVGGPDPSDTVSQAYGDEVHRLIEAGNLNGQILVVGQREDVINFYLAADQVVNEAMAFGLPIIATDAAGCAPDLVQSNGLVVPAGDVDALADALRQLLADEPLRQEMGQRSRAIIANYTVEAACDTFLQAINHALAK